MTQITYVPTLSRIARELCRYVAIGTPVITRLYPTNTELLAALAAANSACSLLQQELEKVRDYGD